MVPRWSISVYWRKLTLSVVFLVFTFNFNTRTQLWMEKGINSKTRFHVGDNDDDDEENS